MVHQMRVALPQCGNGRILGVAGPTLEPLEDQHPVALVLADAFTDRLETFAESTG